MYAPKDAIEGTKATAEERVAAVIKAASKTEKEAEYVFAKTFGLCAHAPVQQSGRIMGHRTFSYVHVKQVKSRT